MSKTANLTPVQADLVHRLATETLGGRIERRRGGFWTAPETIADARGVPDWYVTRPTVEALWRKGVVEISATRQDSSGVAFVVEYRLTA